MAIIACDSSMQFFVTNRARKSLHLNEPKLYCQYAEIYSKWHGFEFQLRNPFYILHVALPNGIVTQITERAKYCNWRCLCQSGTEMRSLNTAQNTSSKPSPVTCSLTFNFLYGFDGTKTSNNFLAGNKSVRRTRARADCTCRTCARCTCPHYKKCKNVTKSSSVVDGVFNEVRRKRPKDLCA